VPVLDVFNVVGAGSSGMGSVWNNMGIGFNLSSSARPGFKTEIFRDIVCMPNPKKILEQWEIDKNLAMLISYSVIFVIGVLGNVTAMMVCKSNTIMHGTIYYLIRVAHFVVYRH
jgi:hypothetical protein